MTREHQQSRTVPEWMVERLVAGELSPSRSAEIRRRLAAEPNGLARLEGVAASNDEILRDHPPAAMARLIQSRAAAPPPPTLTPAVTSSASVAAPRSVPAAPSRGRRWVFAFGAPTLAMAALALALWARPETRRSGGGEGKNEGKGPAEGITAVGDQTAGQSATDDGDRIKGLRPGLRLYRKVGDAVERLPPGASAHAGDQLQLAYVAAGRRYGAVLSVDGAGQVTFHLPAAAGPAARLRSDGEVALADAYELDAAPGFEQFVFVSGNEPFDTALLSEVVRGKAAAPAGTVVVSFTVRKE